jgi:glycolate oxidase FAD binding subunit
MSQAIIEALKRVGPEAVSVDRTGLPRMSPRSTEQVAATLQAATEHGWRVRIEGGETWMPPDAPVDLALSTRRLERLVAVAPADLVASVQAGMTIRALQTTLAQHGTYLALDPPGSSERTLGSVLATNTAGLLRHRFGGVRDHVVGTTTVTADGRVVKSGGVVVKNVAGYDLSKLQIGGFGAFGVITEVNLRLRALPRAQHTLIARGGVDPLLDAGRALAEANVDAAALEIASPAMTGSAEWCLVVHFVGTDAGINAELERTRGLARDATWETVPPPAANALMQSLAKATLDGPTTLRFGVFASSVPELVDFLGETLGHGHLLAGLGRGGIRWTGSLTPEAMGTLRRTMAEREIPVTVERAPWAFRRAVGHFGALREGVRPLTSRVRAVFDPAGILPVPLESSADG